MVLTGHICLFLFYFVIPSMGAYPPLKKINRNICVLYLDFGRLTLHENGIYLQDKSSPGSFFP